jgi:hypothetical protein
MFSMAAKPVVKWMASFTTAAMGRGTRGTTLYGNDTMGTAARSRKGATNKLISPWHRHAAVSVNQVEPPLGNCMMGLPGWKCGHARPPTQSIQGEPLRHRTVMVRACAYLPVTCQ